MSRFRRDERAIDEDEELWFNEDEEDLDESEYIRNSNMRIRFLEEKLKSNNRKQ